MLAAYQHSRRSARKIAPFIGKHKIDMSQFEPVQYRSYAEFFERRFRAGVRSFPPDPGTMGAFAEARWQEFMLPNMWSLGTLRFRIIDL